MKTFIVTLKHDEGDFTLEVRSYSEQRAKDMVVKSEGCPYSAIIKVEEYNPSLFPQRCA